MSTEQQPSRPARGGGGAAPVGSTVAIVVAVVAVVLGFLILRDLRDEDDTVSSGDTTETTTGVSVASTTAPAPVATTTSLVFQGAKVIVANASGESGTAGKWTTALQTRGFTMVTPATNASGAESRLDVTKVYVVGGSEAVANSVAAVLGGVAVEAMPSPAPTQDAIGDATVLVMLGKDIASKTLAEVEPSATPALTTTTAVAGATTSAPPAG